MATVHEADPNLPIEAVKDVVSVRRVFGEAYEADGVTIIPVARVRGGSGTGYGSAGGSKGQAGGDEPDSTGATAGLEGSGGGGGLGVAAAPAGAYVVRGGRVEWRPAIDVNRVILGGQVVACVVAIAAACVLRARSPRHR